MPRRRVPRGLLLLAALLPGALPVAGASAPQPLRPVTPVPGPPAAAGGPPLRVAGSTPPWVGGASFRELPRADAFHELYAGRADLVLGTLPPPPPPGGTDRPLSVAVGVYPVSVAYRLPGVGLRLDLTLLCRLLAGEIHLWNDPALRALNPAATLPALPVLVSARVAPNGVSFAVAGACVKAGVWPAAWLKSNWVAGAVFTRATLGAQHSDLNIPGALALFGPKDVPPGAQLALLRTPGGGYLSPRDPSPNPLGLSGPRLPGAPPLLPRPFGALHLADSVGAYPLRGLVWASLLPEQRYRGRTQGRALRLLELVSALRSASGSVSGFVGLPPQSWTPLELSYGGGPLSGKR